MCGNSTILKGKSWTFGRRVSTYCASHVISKVVLCTGIADWDKSLDVFFCFVGFSVQCLTTFTGTCGEIKKQSGHKCGECCPERRS